MSKTYTEAGAAFSEMILEVFRLNGRLLAEGDRLVQRLGLTSARWQVLGAIASARDDETVARLARNMGLNRQGVQRIVRELAAEGIVELADNPHHRRAKLVLMTARGRSLYDASFALQAPWANATADGLAREDIEAATATIRRLRSKLESTPHADDVEDLDAA